jgi:formylglycine-generating enzyme required for sulfatase activity
LPYPDNKRGLEHLAVVSPFFIDATEVTVKAFVASQLAGPSGPGQHIADAECNYDTTGALDDHPVNCIGFGKAEDFCKKKGARLPTEAEWEYVATALGRYTNYPWGEDEPRCGDAIYARSVRAQKGDPDKLCAPPELTAPVGTALRDRVAPQPGGPEVFDLAGNVVEWMADDYADEWEPCWNVPILLDPKCVTKETPPRRSGRGGAYSSPSTEIDVTSRRIGSSDPSSRPYNSGFRCARPSD